MDRTAESGWYANPSAQQYRAGPAPAEVFDFHQRLHGYGPTALRDVPGLAAELRGRVQKGIPAAGTAGIQNHGRLSTIHLLSAR
jgi:hypothetical protein